MAPAERPPTQPVFAALADPTRRRVLQRLAEEGPATITRLAAGLPMTRQAVSKHLGVLEEAGLVAARKEGRERRYTLTPAPLDEALGWIGAVGARWDARLAALQRQLTSGEGPSEAVHTPGVDNPAQP